MIQYLDPNPESLTMPIWYLSPLGVVTTFLYKECDWIFRNLNFDEHCGIDEANDHIILT